MKLHFKMPEAKKSICGCCSNPEHLTDNISDMDEENSNSSLCQNCQKLIKFYGLNNMFIDEHPNEIEENNDEEEEDGINLKIFYLYYKLFELTKNEMENKSKWGIEDSNNQILYIPDQTTTSPQRVAETLLHEILHSMFSLLMTKENPKEEEIVTKLSTGLSTIWIDNPEIFRYIAFLLTRKRMFDQDQIQIVLNKLDLDEQKQSEFFDILENSESVFQGEE